MGKPGSSKDKELKSERKFEKKVQFYTKVKDTVASLSAQKTISKKKKLRSRQKKLKAYDLTSLTEFLPEVNAPQRPPEKTILKLNSKTRPKLLEKEGKQLKAVRNNPAFQLDPLAAIHQHLESTQPAAPVQKPKKKLSKAEKKKKGKKSKASSAGQAMEM